ncbi:MAG: Tetratricopeptide repeat protein [Acidobacteria bacterium ADurb.Bin051]|jgi:tetratricopeptide (TPR) repeat protein|nr:MAG: Tetratricopeptide repeat protein [Acidobacteria bacterium ADurb.Bin051]
MIKAQRLLLFLAILFVAGSAFAQNTARVHGVIRDQDGNPVAGVKISIPDPDVKGRVAQAVSDEHGKYQIVIADATKPLAWRIEKEGFHTTETPRKVPAALTVELDITIFSLDVPLPMGEVPGAEEIALSKERQEAKIRATERFNEGAALYNAKDLDGALAKFEEAVAEDPELAPAHSVIARIHHGRQQWAAAAAAAERAAELKPDDAVAQLIRFDAWSRVGDQEKVLAALEGLKKADPANAAKVIYQRGEELFNTNDTPAALALFQEAVEIDPNNARAFYRLGLCYVNMNKTADAKTALERFIALAPDDPEAGTAREMLSYLK